METEPQLLHVLAPNEAVVAIGVEVRIADTIGMMNIALPSIVIKMMRQKFDQQWSMRKTHTTATGTSQTARNAANRVPHFLEARLSRLELSVRDSSAPDEGHFVELR
jgi:flagellar motor switch protein FliM